jgi:oxygen-independent coproporphyrinogen-3 oxidase
LPLRPPEAIYLHLPFCRSRCSYCAFHSAPFDPVTAGRYLAALEAETELLAGYDPVPGVPSTLFIGGGTPTVLPERQLERLCRLAASQAESPSEFTVEANPESLDAGRLALLADAGVTRISVGAQGDDDRLLRRLGRPHTRLMTERAAALVTDAGIDLSVDLIYGLPGQGRRGWERTLRWALGLGAVHVSAYALTLEEGTPLAAAAEAGEARIPGEETLRTMYDTARALLGDAGFSHYELSNYALPGHECRHNLAYWRYRPYLGLGAAAHSRLHEGETVVARENPVTAAYLAPLEAAPPRDPGITTRLTPEEVLREILLIGLRLREGIDPAGHPGFTEPLRGLRSSALWRALLERGLARPTASLALTPEGWWLADEIAGEAASQMERE